MKGLIQQKATQPSARLCTLPHPHVHTGLNKYNGRDFSFSFHYSNNGVHAAAAGSHLHPSGADRMVIGSEGRGEDPAIVEGGCGGIGGLEWGVGGLSNSFLKMDDLFKWLQRPHLSLSVCLSLAHLKIDVYAQYPRLFLPTPPQSLLIAHPASFNSEIVLLCGRHSKL